MTVELNAERVMTGVAAAEGLAVGVIALEGRIPQAARAGGDVAEERAALDAAVAQARDEIACLQTGGDILAAEILEFQSALLEDDDLLGPVYAAIEAGRPADVAWREVLDGEIAIYGGGENEYLAARADDLRDLQQRVLRALVGADGDLQAGGEASILVADDLTPSRFLELDWARLRGAAIRGGSRTSHVAILARARGVPLIVGLDTDLAHLVDGTPGIIDAENGRLILSPNLATLIAIEQRLADREKAAVEADRLRTEPAVTAGGTPVQVLINVDEPAILSEIDPNLCDGIGLVRTEFLFQGGALPDEDSQYEVYCRIVTWARGRPVTIRTLDAGGDKPIPGVTPDNETNPFLGVRGLRLSLRHEALFRTQLRALARAGAVGPVKVMVPMVTVPGEMTAVRRLMAQVLRQLESEDTPHAAPPLGMMVEVPAAALTAEDFDADFYSIGSNDLIQYVTATARDNSALAELADPGNPAVVELIRRTVEAADCRGVEVSLCGDMASDPTLVSLLLDCGLRRLSVAPTQVARVKQAIRRCSGGAVP